MCPAQTGERVADDHFCAGQGSIDDVTFIEKLKTPRFRYIKATCARQLSAPRGCEAKRGSAATKAVMSRWRPALMRDDVFGELFASAMAGILTLVARLFRDRHWRMRQRSFASMSFLLSVRAYL